MPPVQHSMSRPPSPIPAWGKPPGRSDKAPVHGGVKAGVLGCTVRFTPGRWRGLRVRGVKAGVLGCTVRFTPGRWRGLRVRGVKAGVLGCTFRFTPHRMGSAHLGRGGGYPVERPGQALLRSLAGVAEPVEELSLDDELLERSEEPEAALVSDDEPPSDEPSEPLEPSEPPEPSAPPESSDGLEEADEPDPELA